MRIGFKVFITFTDFMKALMNYLQCNLAFRKAAWKVAKSCAVLDNTNSIFKYNTLNLLL